MTNGERMPLGSGLWIERARWKGADLALQVGTDPNISLHGLAAPVGRRPEHQRRTRSHSPVRSWIVDSGSAFDIVCRNDLAVAEAASITESRNLTLQTANGDIDATEGTDVEIHQLGHTTDAVVLDKSPNVLSLGKLIASGHSFHWPHDAAVGVDIYSPAWCFVRASNQPRHAQRQAG